MSLVVQAWPAIEDALRTTRPLPTKATNLAYENPGCSRKCSTTDRCGTHANGRAAEKAAVQDFLEALFRTRTGDPLLTMERLRQLVANHGNGFGFHKGSILCCRFWRHRRGGGAAAGRGGQSADTTSSRPRRSYAGVARRFPARDEDEMRCRLNKRTDGDVSLEIPLSGPCRRRASGH